MLKKNKIFPAFVLKHKLKREKQIISYSFNDSKRRKAALHCCKRLSALLREITSKHDGDFYIFEFVIFELYIYIYIYIYIHIYIYIFSLNNIKITRKKTINTTD